MVGKFRSARPGQEGPVVEVHGASLDGFGLVQAGQAFTTAIKAETTSPLLCRSLAEGRVLPILRTRPLATGRMLLKNRPPKTSSNGALPGKLWVIQHRSPACKKGAEPGLRTALGC